MVRFDPSVGSEIQKTRPSVVIQNNIGNRLSPVTIVSAISSRQGRHIHPTQVSVSAPEGGLDTDSCVLLNQVRTVDKNRLLKKLGTLKPHTMDLVDHAIEISLGLVAI